MAKGNQGLDLQDINTLFQLGAVGGMSDAQLLARFTTRRDEGGELAFEALVERHGPMVLRVCRAVLRDSHDAHDAFQTTFLVLVRRAESLWVRESLAPWLHQVAHRAASHARAASARRDRLERQAAERASRPAVDDDRLAMAELLHGEVARLPGRYREAVVLCLMEGLSPEEAAGRLGVPLGTVHSRLARGRHRLRSRLARHGLNPSSAGSVLAGFIDFLSIAPAELVQSTTRLAIQGTDGPSLAGSVPAKVSFLIEGVLKAMLLSKIKMTSAMVLSASLAVAGLALLSRGAPGFAHQAVPEEGKSKSGVSSTVEHPGLKTEASPTVALEPRSDAGGKSDGGGIIAVGEIDSPKVWAFNTKARTWHTYRAPEGTIVRPYPFPGIKPGAGSPTSVAGKDFIALGIKSERITEIAVFSLKAGGWVRQLIDRPANGNTGPMACDEQFALYMLSGHAYAFSALTGTWDSVDLGQESGSRLEKLDAPGMAIVKGTGPLYAYDATTGRFKDLESDEKPHGKGHRSEFSAANVHRGRH